jgi:threonine/homoserine/homoserine lactone efflux protein
VLAAPTLFTALKWIGAEDLIWLGMKLIRAAPNAAITQPETGTITALHKITHAATVSALNPKFIAVFIAVVPQFVAPDAHTPGVIA